MGDSRRSRSKGSGGAVAPVPRAAGPTRVHAGRIGPYEIMEELGRGGVGIVFRVRHARLGTFHALKLLIAGACATRDEIARFHREATAAARMGKHPNIVSIQDLGEEGGNGYYVMELVRGLSLEEFLVAHRMTPVDAALMIERVARALHFAHQRGIIHRDVKPANILLRESGEPVLTDFGLARDFQERHAISKPGQVMGTFGYMSPEQALGRIDCIDARTDVFAAGAVLYELLTGNVPHPGRTPSEIIASAVRGNIVPPRRFCPQIPAELETVVMTCLATDPARRYASALALAEDLERWRKGRPVVAWAVSGGEIDSGGAFQKGWTIQPRTRERIEEAVRGVLAVLGSFGYDASQAQRVEQAIRELTENAIEHGCRGREDGLVQLQVEATRDWIRCVVQDDGPGFDFEAMVRREAGSVGGRLASRGHGLLLLRRICDRLTCPPPGNAVTALIRRSGVRVVSRDAATGTLHLAVEGILDTESSTRLSERLEQILLGPEWKWVIVDLGQVTYLSSAGVGTLAHAAGELSSRGGRLVVVENDRISQPLRLLGMEDLFAIVRSMEDARRVLSPGAGAR